MILVIDNFDSFTYNIYQLLGGIGAEMCVRRNNEIDCRQIEALKPEGIIISPGPGYPKDAGISKQVITEFYRAVPILGICLGHQSIVEVFGGKIQRAPVAMHGKTSELISEGSCPLWNGVSKRPLVGRYHSLAAAPDEIPAELLVTSRTEDGVVMSVRHREFPVFGIQFHPESVLTPEGEQFLSNFLDIVKEAS